MLIIIVFLYFYNTFNVKFMRIKLLVSILFICGITKAQTNLELKDFINKNNVAIRTVQKNMLHSTNNAYVTTFKELVKNQEAAVKLYSTDQKASCYFAFLARTESLNFLKKNTQGSTEYFEISESEKNFTKSSSEDHTKVLSTSKIKSIDSMDAMNPQSLNSLTLSIQ